MKTPSLHWALPLVCSLGLTIVACNDDDTPLTTDPDTPECTDDTECDDGFICSEQNTCVEDDTDTPECTDDTECDDGFICSEQNTCVEDDTDTPECADDTECNDGFVCSEQNTCVEDDTPLEPTAFRIHAAEIADPHLYLDFLVCADVTNDGVLGQLEGGVNGMLADALAATNEEDEDVFDMSIALLVTPLTQQAGQSFDAELRLPVCDLAHENCTDDPDQPIVFTTATNLADGEECFPASEHLGRNEDYGPINNPKGPCFKSDPTDVSLSIAGIDLDLIEASVAAQYVDEASSGLTQGLLVGFLPKRVADEAMIEVPLLGEKSISDFLGKPGHCDGEEDMDTFNDEDGWWMYLNFEATLVDSWTD